MRTLGDQAKAFREAKGWTSKQMAEAVGTSRQNIESLETHGNRIPKYIGALAEVVGRPVDDMLVEAGLAPRGQRGAAASLGNVVRFGSPSAFQTEPAAEYVIKQYAAGGAMGHGLVLEAEPPGLIKSWVVDPEWLRLNVPHYTSVQNLCIVTGFGPSMRGMFNPGDPLLCDTGVRRVDHDGVYFFRVDHHGFIKILQRIPTDGGVVLRAKSKNPDYDPFDITPRVARSEGFEVFGKILTVWKSEQQ